MRSSATALPLNGGLVCFAWAFCTQQFHAALSLQRSEQQICACRAGHADAIKAEISKAGFTIQKERRYQMSVGQAAEFYQEHKGKEFYTSLTLFMASGEIIALELVKEGAIPAWRALCGPTNSLKAKEEAPESLRARFGTSETLGACLSLRLCPALSCVLGPRAPPPPSR